MLRRRLHIGAPGVNVNPRGRNSGGRRDCHSTSGEGNQSMIRFVLLVAALSLSLAGTTSAAVAPADRAANELREDGRVLRQEINRTAPQ